MIKNIGAHLLQQRVLRLKVRIKRASPDIRFIQDLLNGYVVEMLLFQQLVKSPKDRGSCFLLSPVTASAF